MAYIFDKDIKASCHFHTPRHGVLKIGNTAFISVYYTYFNDSIEHMLRLDEEISTIINNLRIENFEIVLLGDFNCDPSKDNYNTTKLKKLLVEMNLSERNIITPDGNYFKYQSRIISHHM
jgi:endonuclease/exonuclease/phosphatase family metal-dependent hydrolase